MPKSLNDRAPVSPPVQNPILGAWATDLFESLKAHVSAGELEVLRRQAAALKGASKSAPQEPTPSEPTPLEPTPSESAPATTPNLLTIVRDTDSLSALAAALDAAQHVVIRLVTSHDDPQRGCIVGIGLADDAAAYYVPVCHRANASTTLRPDQLPLAIVLEALNLDKRPLVTHDAKSVVCWLRRHAGVTCRIAADTMITARLRQPDAPCDLGSVVRREVGEGDGDTIVPIPDTMHAPIDGVASQTMQDLLYIRYLYLYWSQTNV